MDQAIVFVALCIALSLHIAVASVRDTRNQRTIDRLTDKLMAKDYGEYKRLEWSQPRTEPKERKPMSYYDDPSIPAEE